MSLTAEDLRTVQLRSLAIYKAFEAFCLAHDLTVYVCGGGLIGALRCGGFIPWDDDMDIFMPRTDYDRLWALWEQDGDHARYHLVQPGKNRFCGEQISYLYDLNAPCVRAGAPDGVPPCLCLDILPLDGCPKNRIARLFQLACASAFGLYMTGRLPENHGWFVRAVCRFLLALTPSEQARIGRARRMQRRMSRHAVESCATWTELCSGWKYITKRYPHSAFDKPLPIPFEDTTILAPADADCYLRIAFGDYMTPPPENQRVSTHGIASIQFGQKDL